MDAGGIIAGEGNPNRRSTDDVLILDRCTSDVINTLLVACATRDAAFYLFHRTRYLNSVDVDWPAVVTVTDKSLFFLFSSLFSSL